MNISKHALPYPMRFIHKLIQCPIFVYRLGWGHCIDWLPLLVLTTRGKDNGLPQHVALEYRRHGSKYYLFSGWGERSEWVQDIKHNPTVTLQYGKNISNAHATVVSDPDEAMRALYMFQRNSLIHKLILSRLSSSDKINFKTLREIANQFTVIRIDPVEAAIEIPGLKPVTSWVGSALLLTVFMIFIIAVLQVFRQLEESEL